MLRFRSENCKQVSMLRQRAFCNLQPKYKHYSPQVCYVYNYQRLFLRWALMKYRNNIMKSDPICQQKALC